MSNESTIIYDSYAVLVSCALKNDKHAQNWYKWLKMKRKREIAEKEVLEEFRRKRPGLSDYEIICKCRGYLEKNFPVPSFPYTCTIKG